MEIKKEYIKKNHELKGRLGEILSDSASILTELNMTLASKNVSKLGEKVNNAPIRILVIGYLKKGKSTFINSLLGETILPTSCIPITAIINELKYGVTKEAIIHFKDSIPEKLPGSIPSKAMSHMKAHRMKNVPPLKIAYDEIEDYICFPKESDATEMLLESPYEKVELFWPLDILKEGIELIDTPGLTEPLLSCGAKNKNRLIEDYLAKADAIIFVMNAISLCTMEEMNFIEDYLKRDWLSNLFFIVNGYDLIPASQKEIIKKFTEMKLSAYSTNPIFYISAQQALDSLTTNSESLFEESNMKECTKALYDFLISVY